MMTKKKKKNNNTALTIYSVMTTVSLFVFIISIAASDISEIAWCSNNGWNEGYCFSTAIMFIPTFLLLGLSLTGFIVFLILAIVESDKISKKEKKKRKPKTNNPDDDYDDGL